MLIYKNKWLEIFNNLNNVTLSSGKACLRDKNIQNLQIKENIVTAEMNSLHSNTYPLRIELEKFGKNIQKEICDIIVNSPAIFSALLNKELPEELFDALEKQNIRLIPNLKKNPLKMDCKCCLSMPCQHIVAIIYILAEEIGKNPLLLFTLHGCNLSKLISNYDEEEASNIRKILKIEDVLNSKVDYHSVFNHEALDAINLSVIQNCNNDIFGILKNNPIFFKKNFRDILQKTYAHWKKYPNGENVISKESKNSEFSEEEIFNKKWGNPESWSIFQLIINNFNKLIATANNLTSVAYNDKFNLVEFLEDIPSSIINKLNHHIQFMHAILQFAKKLIEKEAFIPQILQNKEQYFFIRWVPALFNEKVDQIFKSFCLICPEGIAKYQKYSLSAEEQVKTLISIMISNFISNNFSSYFINHQEHEIFKIFFTDKPCQFRRPSNQSDPIAIYLWLSHLYLGSRLNQFSLIIQKFEEGFDISLMVSFGNDELMTIQEVFEASEHKEKLEIFSNFTLISSYIPESKLSLEGETYLSLENFTPLFLVNLPILKAIGVKIILPKELQNILKPQLNLSLNSKSKIENDRKSFLNLENILEFDWKIAIGEKKLDIEEFKKLLETSKGLVQIMDEYVLLDEKDIDIFSKKIAKLPKNLNQADLMQAILCGQYDDAEVDIDSELTLLFSRLSEYSPHPIPHNLKATLRPYQERGFNWLIQNIETNFGSILADDMGLGKTIQVIASILHFKNHKMLEGNSVLIVAPTSLLNNWKKEVERFAPDLSFLIYHGQNRELLGNFDVIITSYGLMRRDAKEFNKTKWFLLIIDEAQNIKNPGTDQTKALKSIEAKHKIAMSGTPVENRLLEYWSIFDFTNKHYLGNTKQFKTKFAIPIEKANDKECLERFKKVTSPFILRRFKNDQSIIQDLPEKIEKNCYCSLTIEQAALYQEVVNLSIAKINSSEGIERKGLILKLINSLKQICNHPSQFGKKTEASINQSGKMQILEEILSNIDEMAEKALIFTQYTEMGEILTKLIEKRFNSPVPFFHGGLSLKARDEMVNDFQTDSQKRILIISLKAGGTGLNLTEANHVIHYDLWWNPAVESQATDRAYRIGQKRNVIVHRLITINTFEERIDEMITSKKALANLAVNSGENWITEMSTAQLRDLVNLRKA